MAIELNLSREDLKMEIKGLREKVAKIVASGELSPKQSLKIQELLYPMYDFMEELLEENEFEDFSGPDTSSSRCHKK